MLHKIYIIFLLSLKVCAQIKCIKAHTCLIFLCYRSYNLDCIGPQNGKGQIVCVALILKFLYVCLDVNVYVNVLSLMTQHFLAGKKLALNKKFEVGDV